MEVARIGDYELTFTAGGSGIAEGGTLLVAFPKAWFTNPYPIVKPIQQKDPAGPHYVSVSASRAGTRPGLSLDKISFAGKIERFNWMMTVRIDGEPLKAGDTVHVKLSRTTAPYVPGRDRVRIAIDAEDTLAARWLRSTGFAPHGMPYFVAGMALQMYRLENTAGVSCATAPASHAMLN